MNQTELKKFIKKSHACVPIFIAFGDEVRQHLFFDIALSGENGINVNSLTEKSHLSRPAISYHLKVLKSAGLVKYAKKGTQIFYSADKNSKNLKLFKETIEFFYKMIETTLENPENSPDLYEETEENTEI